MIYMVIWSGGYDPASIAVTSSKTDAYNIADGWKVDADDGDSISILVIDGVEPVEAGRLGVNNLDVIL